MPRHGNGKTNLGDGGIGLRHDHSPTRQKTYTHGNTTAPAQQSGNPEVSGNAPRTGRSVLRFSWQDRAAREACTAKIGDRAIDRFASTHPM